MDNGGMTGAEEAVMNALVRAWDKYVELQAAAPAQFRPDDLDDFRRAIHDAQRLIGMRVVRRDHPDYWSSAT